MLPPTLVITRFNTATWEESQRWRINNAWDGCIYCTPVLPKAGIGETLIVLEMHNDENEIKAVGIVKNRPIKIDDRDKTQQHRVYAYRNYTRYIYKSPYRLVFDKIILTSLEKKIITILNRLLFKGACHLKRGQGLTVVPPWIMQNKYIDFLKAFKALLKRHFNIEEAEAADTSAADTSAADTTSTSAADTSAAAMADTADKDTYLQLTC
jgi:hypothetical protein